MLLKVCDECCLLNVIRSCLPVSLPPSRRSQLCAMNLCIHSLQHRADLNGRVCTDLGPLRNGKRKLSCDGNELHVKESNLETKDERDERLINSVDAVMEELVNCLLRESVDAAAQDHGVKAAIEEERRAKDAKARLEREQEQLRREAREAEEEALWDAEEAEYGYPFLREDYRSSPHHGTPREVYEKWLSVSLEHRRHPELRSTVPAHSDLLGGITYYGGQYEYDEHHGPHPYNSDYAYVSRLGKGRVLWDIFRPTLRDAMKAKPTGRIHAMSIMFYWMEAAAKSAMQPVNLNPEAELRSIFEREQA